MSQYVDLVSNLLPEVRNLVYKDYAKHDEIMRRVKLYVRNAFSEKQADYYLQELNFILFSPTGWISGTPIDPFQEAWESGKAALVNLLNVIIEDLNMSNSISSIANEANLSKTNQKVFVVHGHDSEMKQAVARTLTTLGLEPIILHEQVNMNRTIIEKFETFAGASSFAVVLLSPDDMAYPKGRASDKALSRARQNVVLELGFFLGKLGRDHVFVLYRQTEKFEFPSDYDGVLYTAYDSDVGAWRFSLISELQAVGYEVSADSLTKKKK